MGHLDLALALVRVPIPPPGHPHPVPRRRRGVQRRPHVQDGELGRRKYSSCKQPNRNIDAYLVIIGVDVSAIVVVDDVADVGAAAVDDPVVPVEGQLEIGREDS